MIKSTLNQYQPDYAIHPGEILEETLITRKIQKNELAELSGLTVKTISLIINGKASVTPDTAIQFDRVLGVSASIWNNLDANYRLFCARRLEQQRFKDQIDWSRRFPVRELKDRNIIPADSKNIELVKALLDFFGAASPAIWNSYYKNLTASFRKSTAHETSFESMAAWLRIGHLQSERIETEPYNKYTFIKNLHHIRELTVESPDKFSPQMRSLCAKSGVALVLVSELPRTHIYGATRWLNKDKALLMLSLRYKTNNHFWFTFFHEAAHIIFHGKKSIFIDEKDMVDNKSESSANQFSRNILVPHKKYEAYVAKKAFNQTDIEQFAKSVNVAPGIVVGFLQHDKHIPYSWHNKLKEKFNLIS